MTILFAGTEMDAFNFSTPPSVTVSTGDFDSVYVRHGLNPIQGSVFKSPKWVASATDNFWLHAEVRLPGSNASPVGIYLNDASGVPWLRYHSTGSTLQLDAWNGASWSVVASIAIASLHAVDIQYSNGVSGRIALYVNNYLLGAITGDFSTRPDLVELSVVGRTTNPLTVSQIIASDESTIGFKLAYRQPTANGNYDAWTGIWSDVDDAAVTDVSSVSSTVADQRESFTKAIFNTPSGNRIKAVGVTARARRGASGLANLALMLRFGSTDYDSADKALELGLTPVQEFWHVNPATGIEWVPADAGSVTLEFGLKART